MNKLHAFAARVRILLADRLWLTRAIGMSVATGQLERLVKI